MFRSQLTKVWIAINSEHDYLVMPIGTSGGAGVEVPTIRFALK
jgi:hypothetical protein